MHRVCFMIQSSPPLVLESGGYYISIGANCPNAAEIPLPPLNVDLDSRKAYFILVSGWPLRAELVSNFYSRRHKLANVFDASSIIISSW